MSWIALDDVLGAFLHVLTSKDLVGPINFVAPELVSNQQFSETLAGVLKRPCLIPLPALVVKLLFGQLGEELLLASIGVRPEVLLTSGYLFRFPELKSALEGVLKK